MARFCYELMARRTTQQSFVLCTVGMVRLAELHKIRDFCAVRHGDIVKKARRRGGLLCCYIVVI